MSHPVDVYVGKQLKQMRILRGLSQTDVAKKLSLSFQQVQKYEIGSNRISASRLFELSNILDVPPSYFFEGYQDTPQQQTQIVDDESIRIASVLSRIQDDRVKSQIKTFIDELASDAA